MTMTAPLSELATAASGSVGTYTFVDEEELLGFKIWVAELELLVGNARGRVKPDPVQCFQLLQKLVVSLDRASRPEVKEFQRRCEEAAMDVLLKGAPPPVRRLICQALAKLYLAGDQLPLYSRVSSLQLFLGTREAFSKEMHEDVRLGALECMAALYYAQGRFLSIGVQETVAVAAKYCAARHLGERAVQAALNLLAAAVEGVGGGHRHAQAVQQDVFRAVERLLSSREPPSSEAKQACANVLRALGTCGGAFLWANSLAGFEAAKALCLAGLGDADAAVRAAFAQALAAIAVASSSDAAKDSCRALEKKPKYKAAQEKALSDVPTACLTTPFVEAASYSNRPVCTALAQAWVAYLTAVRASGVEEEAFVDSALRVLEMLGAACLASGSYQEASIVPGEGELGLGTGSGERPHAQACALYVLRVGVIEQLGEGGQRLLLDRLAGVLSAPLGLYTPVGVVILEAMALLLEVLGEVSAEKRAELEPVIGAKVAGPHACLRLQAAAAVAALAVAEPSSAARLVSASLANLHAAREKLLAATEAAAPDRSRPSVPSTPRGVGSVKLKPDMNAVHGWALSGAALVAASRRLPLGVPSTLLASVLDYAVRLIREPRGKQGVVSCLELEVGYILLSSVAASLPAEQLLEGVGGADGLLRLLEPALGKEAATELDRRYCSNVSSLDYVVAMELWWRTAALQSFLAIVAGPLAALPRADQPSVYERAAALLKPTLDVLMAHAALQEPARAKGGPAGMFAGAAALLQLRLLEAYAALPNPAAYEGEQEALTNLCMRAVRSAATGAAGQMLHSALRRWLDSGDALLGPWQQGRDPLEQALHSFEGVAGGPHVAPWQAGSRKGIGYAIADEGEEASMPAGSGNGTGSSSSGPLAVPAPSPYPQPRALGAALLEAQLALVGRILATVAPVNQAAIMDALIAIASGGPQKRKDKEPAKRQAAAMAAASAALASMAALVAGGRAALQAAGAELAPRMRQLADEVLEEAGGSVALQRAASDLYAASAQLSSDAAAAALVRALCKEMAETASLPRRAALALAVGSCGRAVGGLSLQAVLPMATDTLVAVARASDKSISVRVMHAMLLLANAAGLAFVPHLRQLLDLAQGMLLSEEAYSLPGLLPAAGRLANASVALLGPDYAFGSRAYLVCKSIINDMRALELTAGALSTDDAVSAALETVLYSQMLVLFAPQAVPAKSHLPVLVGNLLSRQPRLRKAAADTLRHLAERDPQPVAAERVETALFAALDGETDPAIASQIKATLTTLLAAGAAREPSHWVTLCAEVVTAATPGSTAAAEEQAAAEAAAQDSDDEEGAVSTMAPAPAAPPATPPASGPGGAANAAAAARAPRLRTRLFAAQLLLQLPEHVCASGDQRHTDLDAAQAAVRAGQGSDWLVLRLQQLVDLSFRMASGQLEALRPRGVRLMAALLAAFGDSPDPMLEGARLMELYQAQVVSTLRASLAVGAAPSLAAAGASLAAAFLEKGLDGGDATVLQRLMGLLSAPLAQSGGAAQDKPYAEWVGVRARVALLEAHAHCAALAAAAKDPDSATGRVVRQSQAPHRQLLLEGWLGLLQDYVAVCTQPPEVHGGYRLRLVQAAETAAAAAEGVAAAVAAESSEAAASEAPAGDAAVAHAVTAGPTPTAVMEAVRPALQRAWLSALDAAACLLAEQPEQAAGSAAAREQHALLLDVCQMALSRAAEGVATAGSTGEASQQHQSAGLAQISSALAALRRLTAPDFVAAGWLEADVALELASRLQLLLQGLLLPLAEAGALALEQVLTLAQAVAAVLKQLPAAVGTQQVVAAAAACLQLVSANAGGSGSSSGSTVAADALTAVSKHLAAAAEAETFVPCLQQALQLGVEVAACSQQPDQLSAAVALLADAAAAVFQRRQAQQGPGAAELPAIEVELSAALQALAQQVERCTSSNGSSGASGAAQPPRLEAALSGLLALAGALQAPHGTASATPAASVAAAAGLAAAHSPAAAQPTAQSFGDDDWEDDPFGDSGSAEPAALGSAEAEGEAADAAPTAAAEPAAEAAQPGEQAKGQAAGLDEEEDDEWGDGPFAATPPPAAAQPQEAVADASQGLASLSLASSPDQGSEVTVTGQRLALDVLAATAGSQDASVQLPALAALCTLLQRQQQAAPPAAQQAQQLSWALQCTAAALPGSASRVHALMSSGQQLEEAETQVVAQVLKAGLLAVNCASALPAPGGEAAQTALLRILVPLLIEVAAPAGPPTPVLAGSAVKLLTHLASSPAAAAFRAVAAELPAATKARLQAALQAAAAAAAQPAAGDTQAAAGASTGPMQRATVKLNFAAFKK